MRLACALVLYASLSAIAHAEDATPPRLDEVLAQAKKSGKPVIVDFFTTWCHPCKLFDEKILPDAAVQKALGDVIYVRYDAEDGGPGLEAADRYSVSSYPSFLALDADGKIRARFEGLPGDPQPFLTFVDSAKSAMGEELLLAQVKAAPNDPEVLLGAARWYAMRRRGKDAGAFYDRAIKADKRGKAGVAADATWEVAHLRRAAALRATTVKETVAFVSKFPGASRAENALRIAAESGDVPAKQLTPLFAVRRKAVDADQPALNELAYVALASGQLDEALAAAERQAAEWPKDPNALDTLAEVHHYRGEKDKALATEDAAIALAADQQTRDLLTVNRARFAKDGSPAPSTDVEREKQRIDHYFASLEALGERTTILEGDGGPTPDSDSGDPTVKQAQAEFQAFFAVARKAYDAAATSCKDHAAKLSEVYVRVELAQGGGKPTRVVALDPDATPKLKKCLETSLATAVFPKAPFFFKNRYTEAVTFGNGFGIDVNVVIPKKKDDAAAKKSPTAPK